MNDFVKNHPWLTFFLGLAAIDGVAYIIRGPAKITVVNPNPGIPAGPGTQTAGASLGPSASHGKLLPWMNPAAYYRS